MVPNGPASLAGVQPGQRAPFKAAAAWFFHVFSCFFPGFHRFSRFFPKGVYLFLSVLFEGFPELPRAFVHVFLGGVF